MKKHTIFVRMLSLLLIAAFLPNIALADHWYLENGDITVSAADDGNGNTIQTVRQGGVDTRDDTPTISTWDPNGSNAGSSESTGNTITVSAGSNVTADVTLEDVNIDVSSVEKAAIRTEGQGDVKLTLAGENTVSSGDYHAGVEKGNGGNLTITAPAPGAGEEAGSLTAQGGGFGAGIGGGAQGNNGSNITIAGNAKIEANGGVGGAGIGGGIQHSGSNITIQDDSQVEANGGFCGAGIGGGAQGHGDNIIIQGNAQVETNGDSGGAGIGGGAQRNGSNITIQGNAQVKASGDSGSAGIGGGAQKDGSNITIQGNAQVEANGGFGSTGIGGGVMGNGSNITIQGNAQVKANGSSGGAGIGGGASNNGTDITIAENAKVEATGGEMAPGIGSGVNGSSSNIKVADDAQVIVQGGAGSVAIGDFNSLKEPDPTYFTNGWIAYYAPGADIHRDAPEKLFWLSKARTGITVKERTFTCTQDGTITFTEGNHEFTTSVLATGHNWGDYTEDTPASCNHPGSESKHCKNCAATTDSREIPQLQHVFSNYADDHNTTCTQDGTETALCDNGCGKSVTRTKVGSATGHLFTDYHYNGDATCTQDGTETAACEHKCGEKVTRTKAGSALGHLFENYVFNLDATTESDGTETAKCEHAGCTATDTRTARGTKVDPIVPAEIAAYWVKGGNGQALAAKEQLEGGVLTITVQADTASLLGSVSSMQLLSARGVTEVRFVTDKAKSAFLLADLLAYGSGDFALPHAGTEVSCTLDGKDIQDILDANH